MEELSKVFLNSKVLNGVSFRIESIVTYISVAENQGRGVSSPTFNDVRPVAAGTETQTVPNVSTGGGPAETETHTVPTVSTGGGPAVEPLATDIHPQDEQEGFGLTEEVHAACQ